MIIHVPQGYSARLTQDSKEYELSGMYTDGFSFCNIVACLDEEQQKLVLMHVDGEAITSTAQAAQIREQVKWVGDGCKAIIFYRTKASVDNDPGWDGEIVNDRLKELFNSIDIVPVCKVISKDDNGILVKLNPSANNKFEYKIFSKDTKPESLVHHPQEQQLLTARKIGQLIGLKAKAVYDAESFTTTFSLFDGAMWEPAASRELQVDVSHSATKAEMDSFSNTDPWIVLARKAALVASELRKHIPVLKDDMIIGCELAPDLEWYLTPNCMLLLQRNLQDVLNDTSYAAPETLEDRGFYNKCNACLGKPKLSFAEINNLFMDYYQTPSLETKFKKIILADFPQQFKHYRARKYYIDITARYAEMKSKALQDATLGIAAYRKQSYQDAAQFLFSVIQTLNICTLKSDPDLAAAYFNYGRCLQHLDQYNNAAKFLKQSLDLREHYTSPKPSTEQIAKTRAAFEECDCKQTKETMPTLNLGKW